MEERKSYGMVMLFVSVFVVFLVSIMSYSLWRDKQISAFRTTNRAQGIQCDRISQAARVVKAGERVDLEMDHLFCIARATILSGAMMPADAPSLSINSSSISTSHTSHTD